MDADTANAIEREMQQFDPDFRIPEPRVRTEFAEGTVSVLDFEYPVGIKFFPPHALRHWYASGDRAGGEHLEFPEVAAMSPEHARQAAKAWLAFWKAAHPYEDWRLRFGRLDPPGWLRVDIVPPAEKEQ